MSWLAAKRVTGRDGLGSLSLRLTLYLVAVLMAAILSAGLTFDRQQAKLLGERALDQLRLDAEGITGEAERYVERLREDVAFLASTPAVQGFRRAVEGGGTDPIQHATAAQWQEALQQLFIAFATARPDYFQIRLIGARDDGLERLRVDRTPGGPRLIPRDELKHKGERDYFQATADLPAGAIYLSRVDLNQERGQISRPYLPTLRGATPIRGPDGTLFGVLVVNLDMSWVFQRLKSSQRESERLYVIDEQGEFLLHPEPGRAFSAQLGQPFGLEEAFPGQAGRILGLQPGSGVFLELDAGQGESVGYVQSLPLDQAGGTRRMIFLLTEPRAEVYQAIGLMRRGNLIGLGGLFALAVVAAGIMVQRNTRSLRRLAQLAGRIGGGEYRVALPEPSNLEEANLVTAFKRMTAELEQRDQDWEELNRELEQRVEARTRDLDGEHRLKQLILEGIGDGVVVADAEGRFLLWNPEARRIIGLGPAGVAPQEWPEHYGVYRSEGGGLVPQDELPLVRAIRGESTDGVELYLRNRVCAEGRWLKVSGRPLRDQTGEIRGGVILFRDLTEQKQLEGRLEQQRTEQVTISRLALSNVIIRSVAHQLSQPIAAIATYAGAAARLHRDGRTTLVELNEILGNIERLSAEAGEILEAFRSHIHPDGRKTLARLDVRQIVESSLQLLQERIVRQGVRVERRHGPGLPSLEGDPRQIELILTQLITNALDAMEETPQDERRLEVGARYEPDRGILILEVADRGRGISAALTEDLFEPWVTGRRDAPGIGLAIVRNIVEAHKGQILMQAREEGGTCFRVELPDHGEGVA